MQLQLLACHVHSRLPIIKHKHSIPHANYEAGLCQVLLLAEDSAYAEVTTLCRTSVADPEDNVIIYALPVHIQVRSS